MKIRRDSVFISSVLFTVGLFWLMPSFLGDAWTWRYTTFGEINHVTQPNYLAPIGFASLAVILIGLIVVWTGFVKRIRWTWFVMSVIVWVWAFPILILPLLQDTVALPSLSEWFSAAVREHGVVRTLTEGILAFSLMVIALILPIKSFFLGRKPPEPVVDHRP